uniref:RRM domain-containing protein n=1 Tax=Ditylenchus dipsaci TaxID=166011 RepID=A0A915E0E1_9BILA
MRPRLDVFSDHLVYVRNAPNMDWRDLKGKINQNSKKVYFVETFEAWLHQKIGQVILEFRSDRQMMRFVDDLHDKTIFGRAVRYDLVDGNGRERFSTRNIKEAGIFPSIVVEVCLRSAIVAINKFAIPLLFLPYEKPNVKDQQTTSPSSFPSSAVMMVSPSEKSSVSKSVHYVVIRNLPKEYVVAHLMELANQAGEVVSLEPRCFSLVKYLKEESAIKSIVCLNELDLGGGIHLRVEGYDVSKATTNKLQNSPTELDADDPMDGEEIERAGQASNNNFSFDSFRKHLPFDSEVKQTFPVVFANVPDHFTQKQILEMAKTAGEVHSISLKSVAVVGYTNRESAANLEVILGKQNFGEIF